MRRGRSSRNDGDKSNGLDVFAGELGDGRAGAVVVDESESDIGVAGVFGFRGDDPGSSANRFGIGGGVVRALKRPSQALLLTALPRALAAGTISSPYQQRTKMLVPSSLLAIVALAGTATAVAPRQRKHKAAMPQLELITEEEDVHSQGQENAPAVRAPGQKLRTKTADGPVDAEKAKKQKKRKSLVDFETFNKPEEAKKDI